MSLTKPRYNGSIQFDDGIRLPIKRGSVLLSGSSPNAKVSILNFDGGDSGDQVDVMRAVKVAEDERAGQIHLTGQSLFATRQMKLEGQDAIVTVTVDVKTCLDCPG